MRLASWAALQVARGSVSHHDARAITNALKEFRELLGVRDARAEAEALRRARYRGMSSYLKRHQDGHQRAGVAKLADATALGAVVPKGLVGSNPSARTQTKGT